MTLNELLPAIHQLNNTDKQILFEILDHELHPVPGFIPTDYPNEGQWLLAIFDRYFSDIEPIEIPIAPREPMRVDETLFGDA